MKSWKTTAAGAITALGVYLSSVDDPTLSNVGKFLAGVGSFLTGLFARDNGITSKQAGAEQ